MIKSFEEVLALAGAQETQKIAVAVAHDKPAMLAVKDACDKKIVTAILVGDEDKIKQIATEIEFDLSNVEIIDEKDNKKAVVKAVELVSTHKADIVMKGLVDTANFLRAVLNKQVGLRTGKLMSHVGVFEAPGYNRLLFVTDAAFNMFPELKEKVDIIKNAVIVAHALGIEIPKVAPICAVEVVNPHMPATLDASILSKMSDRGQIKGCIIDGPLALDIALSEKAAEHKGVTGPVAGKADIFLVPNIECGNIMYKALSYVANAKIGAILVGTSAPVVLTSRSDTHETKLNSIALAALVSSTIKK